MATHYTITVESLNGEKFQDTVESGMRDEVAHLASLPEFQLGDRVGFRKDKREGYEDWSYYYYHGGRITVFRQLNQLTSAQRQGRRSY